MSERISRRGFLGATVALGGGALLTGCGGGGSGDSGGGASGEVVYNTFLDPANTTDPRAVAQTAAISAFEKANPNIKVRVNVDHIAVVREYRKDRGGTGCEIIFAGGVPSAIIVKEDQEHVTGKMAS